MAAAAWAGTTTSATDTAGVLVARIKALRHAANVWSRKRLSNPLFYQDCSFIILLLDLFEETRALSVGEQVLCPLCKERAALFIKEQAAH